MYSIDTYVDSRGKTWHCPLVKIQTARNIGRDDFYHYSQLTPSGLKSSTVEKAQQVAENAIHALGLRSVTAHTELVKVDDEWKVIEIGARLGGNRPLIYDLSCDINHAVNDILIRIPRKPNIPKKCKGVSGYLKFYGDKEGWITEIKGLKKIEELKSFHSIVANKKVGDRATFAKNGGKAVATVFLYNNDRSKFLADVRRIEQTFKIVVGTAADLKKKQAANKKSSSKTVAKKTKATTQKKK